MSDTQVAITADVIIEEFWYLKLEEIKHCFHHAMMYEEVYDRLDGNTLCRWLRKYDDERTAVAMALSDSDLNKADKQPKQEEISFEQYVEDVTARAEQGDKQAQQDLEEINKFMNRNVSPLPDNEGFRDYFCREYIPNLFKRV